MLTVEMCSWQGGRQSRVRVASWTLQRRCEAHRLALWADEETHRGLACQPAAQDKVAAMRGDQEDKSEIEVRKSRRLRSL